VCILSSNDDLMESRLKLRTEIVEYNVKNGHERWVIFDVMVKTEPMQRYKSGNVAIVGFFYDLWWESRHYNTLESLLVAQSCVLSESSKHVRIPVPVPLNVIMWAHSRMPPANAH